MDLFTKKLTPSQKEVIKSKKNLLITANAGSGKTTVLVKKFLSLLFDESGKYNYKNVVAITFTRKAAADMKRKISEEIKDLKKKNNLNEAQIKKANELIKNIPNLRISTIHSFCADIIREHTFELNINPDFEQISKTEKEQLTNRLIDKVTIDYLYNGKHKDILKRLILDFDIYKYMEAFKIVVEKGDKVSKTEIAAIEDYNDFRKYYLNLLISLFEENYKDYFNLNKIKKYTVDFDDKTYGVGRLKELIIGYDDNCFDELYKVKIELYDLMKNDGKEFLDDLISLLESESELLRRYYNYQLVFIELSKLFNEEFNKYKQQNNYLEHDEILDYSHEILKNMKHKKLHSNDIKYLMVDEFQDTDKLQYDIITQLIDFNSESQNLLLVGDEKQSIYSFRGADIRVFKNAKENLINNDNAETIDLDISFRSTPIIHDFINKFYNNFMTESRSIYDADYKEFTTTNHKQDISSDIEFMILDFHGSNSKENTSVEEAVFYKLSRLISNDIDFKDIAILCDKNSTADNVARYLREKDIPYELTAKGGLFDNYEIRAINNYLKFLDNPENDVYCAATLKSPFFCLTDTDLINIGNKYSNDELLKDFSFWEKFKHYAVDQNEKRYKQIIDSINNNRDITHNIPLSNLIIKLIDDSLFNIYYKDKNEEESVQNNVYKYLAVCRSFENSGFKTYHDFVSQLELIEKLSEDDTANTLNKNAIKILTAHSAKGLEFENVIIAGLDSVMGKNKSSIEFSDKYGLIFSLPKSFNKKFDSNNDIALIFKELNKSDESEKKKAEFIRLLYVSYTRAISSISCTISHSRSADKFYYEQVEKLLDENIYKVDSLRNEILRNTNISVYNLETKEVSKNYELEYPIYLSKVTKNDIPKTIQYEQELEDSKLKDDKSLAIDIKSYERYLEFSATKLMAVEKDYYKEKYVYGLPESEQYTHPDFIEDLNESIDFDGSEKGLLIHKIFENINKVIDDKELTNESLHKFSHEFLGEKPSKKILDLLRNEINSVLNSSFIKENYHILMEGIKEFPLRSAFRKHFLTANLDLLYFNNDKCEIWDWKTNKVKSRQQLEKQAEIYDLQFIIYSYLVFKYDENCNHITFRLLFTSYENKENNEWIKTREINRESLKELEDIILGRIAILKKDYNKYLYLEDDIESISS